MKNEELDRFEIADLIGPSVHGEIVRKNVTALDSADADSDASPDEDRSADSSAPVSNGSVGDMTVETPSEST